MMLCRINRAQILDDSFNLARADLLDYPTALANTEYLIQETDFIPWSSALTGFSYLKNMMKRSQGFGDLKTYVPPGHSPASVQQTGLPGKEN